VNAALHHNPQSHGMRDDRALPHDRYVYTDKEPGVPLQIFD